MKALTDYKDLGLSQIYPVWDEDEGDERVAVSASLADPYLAIVRDDLTLLLLQADNSGDLDEMSMPEGFVNQEWLFACLYADKTGFFSLPPTKAVSPPCESVFLFLLNKHDQLYVSGPRVFSTVSFDTDRNRLDISTS